MKPMNAFRKYGAKLSVAAIGIATGVANAADALDVSSVVAEISAGKAAAVALGMAALGVIATIGVMVWMRRPVR